MTTKYMFVYRTTNLLNGKSYIGQHVTTNLNDGYLGSGTILKKAIEKYGKENFEREILEFASSMEELNKLEIKYIDQNNAVENDEFYNLIEGGHPGCSPMYGKDNPMFGRIGSLNPRFGKHHTQETKDRLRNIALERFEDKTNHPSFGKIPSEETKSKQRAAKQGMYFGEDNPNWGHRWSEELRKKVGEKRKGEFAGGKNPRAKAVRCIETGKVYGCATEAAREYGCDRHWIVDCCNGKRELAGKVHWEYYHDKCMLTPCQDSQE